MYPASHGDLLVHGPFKRNSGVLQEKIQFNGSSVEKVTLEMQ